MSFRGTEVFTIGYQGRDPAELVAILIAHQVDRVIDVRALPLSRRRGFSKTPLREALARHGIDYVHVRAAGNPHRHLADRAEVLAAYRVHLRATPEGIAEVVDAATGHRAALLCVEHDPAECHRSVIAARLRRRGATITDL